MNETLTKINKYKPLIAISLISLLMGGVTASYLLHFRYERQAGISVISNHYAVSIYEDDVLNTEASSVDFPSVIYDDLNGELSTTQTYYLHGEGILASKPVLCAWNCTAGTLYPDDITITAEWYNVDTWESWDYESEYITLTDTAPTLEIRFTCDAVDAYVNNYSFHIDVLANSETG